MVTQGDFSGGGGVDPICHACKVGMVTQGGHKMDVRWKCSCEVTFQGIVEGTPSDMNMRWEWSCKVDTR